MKVKCGRYEYEITSKDLIMDNGSCIQIVGRVSLNCSSLMMARVTFKKLLKDGNLELFKDVNGFLKYYRMKEV